MIINYNYSLDYHEIASGAVLHLTDYDGIDFSAIVIINAFEKKLFWDFNGECLILDFILDKEKNQIIIGENEHSMCYGIINIIPAGEWEILVTGS